MSYISIDIETIPQPGIMDTWFPEWAAKKNPGKEGEELEAMAALYPEFGEIVSVALAKTVKTADGPSVSTKTITRDCDKITTEGELLATLAPYLQGNTVTDEPVLIGHNLKGFDIPFLAKRYMANGMPIPSALRTLNKKPWEVKHIDTMEALGLKPPMSLRAACFMLGLPDPKANCSGADIWQLWKSGQYSAIGEYNTSDAKITLQLYEELKKYGAV